MEHLAAVAIFAVLSTEMGALTAALSLPVLTRAASRVRMTVLRAPSVCMMARGSSSHRIAGSIGRADSVVREPRFITTPIYYVNGVPHIGHAYTSLACDVVARFSRLDGHDVLFLTGTDEHGQKVEQSARAAGETPIALADRVSSTFRSLIPLYDLSCDQFIRTTERRHEEAVQALWTALRSSGDIYLGEYEGWYSVRDEAFYTEDELVDGKAPTGAEVDWVAESSYFFRLSRWQERLEAHIREHEDFIQPVSRRNEVLAFMREGLRDLSISRTTFSWGIAVPPDESEADAASPESPKHIMYVWLDALTNYITAVGYPHTDSSSFTKFWPAHLHMVGKDILRFHAIYWPAFLMAAGLPLPRRVFAHGWWMNDGEKMSKSLGNVIDPIALVKKYGTDQVRYFMLNEVAFGSDGDFSDRKLIECVNAKLANELGNLAYRTTSFTYKQCGGQVPAAGTLIAADDLLLAEGDALLPLLRTHIDKLNLHRYPQALSSLTQSANRYIDVQAPWALKKTDPERMRTVLWVLLETLRRIALLSQPLTPSLAVAILEQLAVGEGARDFTQLQAGCELRAGSVLPEPRIAIPRLDLAEEPVEAKAEPTLSGELLAQLEQEVRAQGLRVRELKANGADKDTLDAEVGALLVLKAKLPEGHELKGGKKKSKQTATAARGK